MQVVQLIHNPGAGEEEHSGRKLKSLIEENGYTCIYTSIREKGWENIDSKVDFIVVAGGDGTVRSVAKELLNQKKNDKTVPIAVLPLGTANNISGTLGIQGETEELIRGWKSNNLKNFDVGAISGLQKSTFFLESFGGGLFPKLMKEMEKVDKQSLDTPEKELMAAQQLLHTISLTYKPEYCKLLLDDKDYSGEYLLVEVLNIRSIGPQLRLAPEADPGDGYFEVVMIGENQREKLANYLQNLIDGQEETFPVSAIRARSILLRWEGTRLHIDDELLETSTTADIEIHLREGLLEFLLPS